MPTGGQDNAVRTGGRSTGQGAGALAARADRAQPVVTGVREAILSGEFAPNQRLVEADLCEQFAASRASVRAALLELANEGLVERMQNRGARVRAVSLTEAIEISEVRMVIEGLCARKAAERVTDEEAAELGTLGDELRAAVASGDVFGYSRLNERLHRRIRAISAQGTASDVLERLRAQNVRHQFKLAMQPGRPQESLPEHLAMIDAIRGRDAAAAEQAAQAHLHSVIQALRTAHDEQSGVRGGRADRSTSSTKPA